MANCILCGGKAVINLQESASRTIYNCPVCGVFVVSDLVEREVQQQAVKLSAFFINRKLRGHNDIVFISFEKNRVDKSYLQMTVEQILDSFPKTFLGQMEGALENLSLRSAFPGEEIRIDRQELTCMFYLSSPGVVPFSFLIKSMQEYGWIAASFFGSSYFPCTVQITPKGWRQVERLKAGRQAEDVALFSLPVVEDPDSFQKELRKVCRSCGLQMVDSVTAQTDGRIGHQDLARLRSARVVVCDLSDGTGESYYFAGMARALGKVCILMCNEKKKKRLSIEHEEISVLFWDSPEMFMEKLTQAIQALI